MTEYKRKLIEVALPLDAINKESAREKSIRHGHPSTLHLWWARRPLAACRAVLFASLVDDPSAHPDRFPTEIAQEVERKRLFAIIEELVKWDNSDDERVLAIAKAEIARSCEGEVPSLLDPFCGGGSIPLEAQRLGLEAFASDLNPVAVLITKALIEIPTRFAAQPPVNPAAQSRALGGWTHVHGLAADVRYYGQWMREEAQRRIGHMYPRVKLPPEQGGGDATVIAWIWARTVKCPNPACGAEMPLISSMSLSRKPGRECWLEPVIDRRARSVTFAIGRKPGSPPPAPKTGRGANFRCMVCESNAPEEHIKAEGMAGRMASKLLAIVAEGNSGRTYLPSDSRQIEATQVAAEWRPDQELADDARALWCKLYGLTRFGDLFTERQLVALTTFSDLVGEARQRVVADAKAAGVADDDVRLAEGGHRATAYADAIATYLAFGLSKASSRNCTLAIWESGMDRLAGAFGRQAMPMTWDYAETNPLAGAGGDIAGTVASVAEVVERLGYEPSGHARQQDAATASNGPSRLVFTDPPYYDNIGYADLADFFYVWLRRALSTVFPDLLGTLLTPKNAELVAIPYRFGGDQKAAEKHFETGLARAFDSIRKTQLTAYPMCVYYAFQQSESNSSDGVVASTGWETMLTGLLDAGFAINGTWPVRSELTGALKASINALASSVVLVCRPRPESAPLATRKDFLGALQAELPGALRRLQQGNIAPVDLAQAAIGPGMAVFSRFAKVVEADGSGMRVRTALGMINRVLDETLAEQDADFDADTRWAVAWFEQFGMNPGDFGVAETLSKAKNSAVHALEEAGIVDAGTGKVRLLDRNELAADWDPTGDQRLTVWEVTQYLIRALETGGESAAAELVGRVGGLAETARELAYRLYNICERKRWAKEAFSYNGLVVAWPAILRVAADESGQTVQLSLGS